MSADINERINEMMREAVTKTASLISQERATAEQLRTRKAVIRTQLEAEMEKAIEADPEVIRLTSACAELKPAVTGAMEALYVPGTVILWGSVYYVVLKCGNGYPTRRLDCVRVSLEHRLNIDSYRQQNTLDVGVPRGVTVIHDIDSIPDKKLRERVKKAVAAVRLKGW